MGEILDSLRRDQGGHFWEKCKAPTSLSVICLSSFERKDIFSLKYAMFCYS